MISWNWSRVAGAGTAGNVARALSNAQGATEHMQ